MVEHVRCTTHGVTVYCYSGQTNALTIPLAAYAVEIPCAAAKLIQSSTGNATNVKSNCSREPWIELRTVFAPTAADDDDCVVFFFLYGMKCTHISILRLIWWPNNRIIISRFSVRWSAAAGIDRSEFFVLHGSLWLLRNWMVLFIVNWKWQWMDNYRGYEQM